MSTEEKRWKVAFGISIALATTLAYSNCPPQYQENVVAPEFASATKTMTGTMSAVDRTLSAQLKVNSERMMSAIAVLTKQKALAANVIADNSRVTNQQLATGLKRLGQTERIKEARFDFGGEFGQGFAPCKVYATRQAIATREADMEKERRERVMSEVLAAPGRYADPVKAQRAMIEANKDSCTEDQARSGLCRTTGSMPGASLTVATLFEPAMEGEKLYDAKVAFINNMVGLPDGEIPAGAAGSPAANAYSLAKMRKDALVSPAIASLKAIQLDYSGVAAGESGGDIPLAVQFGNEVKRYAGNSAENMAWTRVMANQNERGALVEMLKIKALNLALLEKQYRQYDRMEAMLSSLVSLEVQGADVEAASASQRAAKENMAKEIR